MLQFAKLKANQIYRGYLNFNGYNAFNGPKHFDHFVFDCIKDFCIDLELFTEAQIWTKCKHG